MNVLTAERQMIRDIDSRYVALPLALAQRLVFGTEDPGVSAILIQLRRTDMMDAARRRLAEILHDSPQPLETITFHDVSPAYDQVLATLNSIFGFISILMVFITLFLITNAVNMA